MSEISKKPYELSLWKDKLYFLLLDKTSHAWSLSDEIKSNNDVRNDFFKEVKLGVFGGDSMDTPIRAFDVKLTQNVNGSNELLFSIYYKYWDYEKNELVDNPWKLLLTNETKVKLNYDGEYFDFIIKKTSEDTSKYIYTYTGTDLFIEDLSKNGYDIELNDTLMNNTGTILELTNKVLASSEWKLASNLETIKERSKQSLFTYSVTSEIIGTNVEYPDDESKKITIPTKSTIYFFYSDTVDSSVTEPYFLYDPTGVYKTDSNGILVDLPNYKCTRPSGLNANCGIAKFKGERLISQLKSLFIPVLGLTCKEYKNKNDNTDYYEYSKYIYTSGTQLNELIGNNTSFATTDGWSRGDDSLIALSIEYINNINKLKIDFSGSAIRNIYNNGIFNLRKYLTNGFIVGDKYELLIKGTGTINSVSLQISYKDDSEQSVTKVFVGNMITTQVAGYSNYQFVVDSFWDISKTNLNNASSMYLVINGSGIVYIEEALLFKHVIDGAGHLVVPKLSNVENAVIQEVHYFAKKSKIATLVNADDLHYDYIEYGDISNNWIPTYESNFAKVTSITAEKSNRFNILQSLAELFQCWVKFTIGHTNTFANDLYPGSILYNYILTQDSYYISGKRYYTQSGSGMSQLDAQWQFADISKFFEPVKTSSFDNTKYYYEKNNDAKEYYLLEINATEYAEITDKSKIYYLNWFETLPYEKRYLKIVSFHAYIGQDNHVGFRYGINLQSIKRDINTDLIVTKLIVQPNNNEYADSGIGQCSIATSKFSETKENFILNLDYYVKQGLLDESTLLRDLYNDSNTEGIGYIKKISILNRNNNTLIDTQAQLQVDYTINNAYYQKAVETVHAAQTEMDKYALYIKTSDTDAQTDTEGKYPEKSGYNTEMLSWVKLHNIYVNNKKSAESTLNYYTSALLKISRLLIVVTKDLANIAKSKEGINQTFNNKYSRYLREGTWISEDYTNADKYYTDAQNVLYNSAYPQVSYTINVADISAVEGYEIYQFKIADETYVEDVEFFGIDKETKKPIQERVVVTQIVSNLDNPSKNSLTVKNYDNRWESLFLKITASVQSLQFHEGEYKKVADTVESDGTIKSDYLKNAFAQNQVLANALSEEISAGIGVEWSDPSYPEKLIRIASGGIAIKNSDDKGWTTAITADGINASKINTGLLNTENIRIFGGSNANFVWDKDNLTAYAHDSAIISDSTYVRFNQYGIQGIKNGQTVTPVFSLGYNGFELNALNEGGNYVKIDSVPVDNKVLYAGDNSGDKFILYKDGSILANNGSFKGNVEATSGYFGGIVIDGQNKQMRIYNNTNHTGDNITVSTNGIVLNKGSVEMVSLTSGGLVLKDNTGAHSINITSAGITFDASQMEDITTTMSSNYKITKTTIGSASIESPTLIGNEVIVKGGTFTVEESTSTGSWKKCGWFGFATGNNGVISEGSTTYGVAITGSVGEKELITSTSLFPYVICTTSGVRMNSSSALGLQGGIGTWGGKVYFKLLDSNWMPIGSGTAIFG